MVRSWSLTSGDKNQGGPSVEDTSRVREDSSGIVRDGLIDTPVVIGGGSRRTGAVQHVSMEIFEWSSVTTCTCIFVRDPVYLVGSVAPNVISPFTTDSVVVGSNEMATRLDGIDPCS